LPETNPGGEAVSIPGAREGDFGRGQTRADFEVRLEVMHALHWDLAIPCHQVTVAVDGGWVLLSGRVPDAHSKGRAEADASSVPGVMGVMNSIVVES
jgi:osmotically-inducible protein OsmY